MPAIDYLNPVAQSTVFANVNFTLKAGCSDFPAYNDEGYTFCNVYYFANESLIKSSRVNPYEYHSDDVYFNIPMDGSNLPSGYSITDVTVIGVDIYLANAASSEPWSDRATGYFTYTVSSDPIITQQPSLTSPSSGSSGASTTMVWSAAQVMNLGDGTIYYQYFVGPSPSYSDSYHIGTTTELSHVLTEAEIISKCGTGYGASAQGSTCYLFVRAYWQKGQETGGWTTPTGLAFTYYPTINAPTNSSLSRSSGKDTVASWTNQLAGNGSQPQSILRILQNGTWQNIVAGISSPYTIAQAIWETYGVGTYTICIAHEWYGRYANGSSLTFTFKLDNTVAIYQGGSWVDCVPYVWDETNWVQCDPYIYQNDQWILCSTS